MKKYIAECTGTFGLVFCGTGAVVINEISGGIVTHVGIAITFGLVVMAMIAAFGEISGAHLNPAVTLAFAINGNFPVKEILPFCISQLTGAFVASLSLWVLFPGSKLLGATIPSGSGMQSFVLEIILTFLLVLVIIKMATGSKEQGMFAGVAIGSVVLLEAMFAGPISGASMNPARSIAPAVVSGEIKQLWIYVVAPVTGALLAIVIHKLTK
ncbi:MAG TPA: aquaporin [Chitinophagaceae bacterium]